MADEPEVPDEIEQQALRKYADDEPYILINDDDPPMIETVCMWDGERPWEPPPGWRYEKQTDPYLQCKGATWVNGEWVPPPPPPVAEEPA